MEIHYRGIRPSGLIDRSHLSISRELVSQEHCYYSHSVSRRLFDSDWEHTKISPFGKSGLLPGKI